MTDAETPRGRGPALAVASAGYFFVLLDVTIVNVALARIGSGLGGSRSELQWVIDAYALVLAAGMLGMGDLADRTGSRRLSSVAWSSSAAPRRSARAARRWCSGRSSATCSPARSVGARCSG
jgi:DHA2 family methylenomycin A resistance protein-like MFS transporter